MIISGHQPVTLVGVQQVTQLGPKWNGRGAKIVGSLILGVAAVAFVINCAWLTYPRDEDNGGSTGTSGVGIWGLLLFFLPTALVCIMAGVKNQYGLVVATLVMSIISIMTSVLPMLAIASVGLSNMQHPKHEMTIWMLFSGPAPNDNPDLHMAFGAVFIVCSIVLGALLLAASILSCRGLSGLSTVENSYPMTTGSPFSMTSGVAYPMTTTVQYPMMSSTVLYSSSPQYSKQDLPPSYGQY